VLLVTPQRRDNIILGIRRNGLGIEHGVFSDIFVGGASAV